MNQAAEELIELYDQDLQLDLDPELFGTEVLELKMTIFRSMLERALRQEVENALATQRRTL